MFYVNVLVEIQSHIQEGYNGFTGVYVISYYWHATVKQKHLTVMKPVFISVQVVKSNGRRLR